MEFALLAKKDIETKEAIFAQSKQVAVLISMKEFAVNVEKDSIFKMMCVLHATRHAKIVQDQTYLTVLSVLPIIALIT